MGLILLAPLVIICVLAIGIVVRSRLVWNATKPEQRDDS